jgi:hypothetical protein
MNVTISLHAKESEYLDEDEISEITPSMNIALNEEGYDAKLVESPGIVGGKSDGAVEVGTIILSLIGAGGMGVSLVNVLNSYFNQVPKLEVEFEANGKKVKVTATDTEPDKVDETLRSLKTLVQE